jgi:hypothetical protein
MIDDDKDEIDVVLFNTSTIINKLEVLEQLEALKGALQNKGLTKKEINNIIRTQYKAIKNFCKNI